MDGYSTARMMNRMTYKLAIFVTLAFAADTARSGAARRTHRRADR
jgi:hypothetical protein